METLEWRYSTHRLQAPDIARVTTIVYGDYSLETTAITATDAVTFDRENVMIFLLDCQSAVVDDHLSISYGG